MTRPLPDYFSDAFQRAIHRTGLPHTPYANAFSGSRYLYIHFYIILASARPVDDAKSQYEDDLLANIFRLDTLDALKIYSLHARRY